MKRARRALLLLTLTAALAAAPATLAFAAAELAAPKTDGAEIGAPDAEPEGPALTADSAPPPPASFSDHTDSVLVEVPVEVLRDGKPVFGLGPSDFEIYDNGRRQEILGVDAIDRRAERYYGDMPVVARRHFLLLFDLSFTSPEAVARARVAALETVEKRLDPSDLVGVATFRLQEGVRLLLGFSPDRGQVRVALDALAKKGELALRPDPLQLYLGRAVDGVAAPVRADSPMPVEEANAPWQHLIDRQSASRSRRDVAVLSESLGSLARLLRGAAGRKHLVFFSQGFSGDLLGGGDEQRAALDRALRLGDLARVDSDALFGSRTMVDLLAKLTEEMRKADCSLHTVDTSRLGESQGKDGLFLLARDTGAVFFENFNQLDLAFAQLLERTQLTYVLSYRPEGLKGDGAYRKIKVKLSDRSAGGELAREARLSHRPGYFDQAKDAADEGGSGGPGAPEERLLLADRLLDRRPGAIATRLFALPTDEKLRGRSFVPVVVEVDGASFLGSGERADTTESSRRLVLDAQVFVYALNDDGGIADFFSQAIPFDLARHGPALRRRGFKLFAPLLLPAGRFTLRALVRNGERGSYGAVSQRLQVAKKVATIKVSPALVDPEWLLVKAERRDLADLPEQPDTLELLRRAAADGVAAQASSPERAGDPLGGYWRALKAFDDMPWHEALDALESFEVQAAGEDPQNRAPRLGRAELQAAKTLAQKDPDALWPLLGAHHDLYFRHRAAHRPFLELQSRQLVRSLADLAAERGDDALRMAGAEALASIGSILLYEGRAAGFELLERCLDLDPANEAAYLGLAAYYEKFGGPYERAVEWLDQLVLRRPDSREGRLRLAINLLRLEGPAAQSWPQAREDAGRHFERLLADPQNDWISSVAAQELARFHRDDPAAAAALLEKALEARPDDAEIEIQLTFLYDRLELPEKSRALAAKLGAGGPAGETGPSPRGRYNQWTSEALAAGRRALQDGARDRVAALGEAAGPPGLPRVARTGEKK